MDDLMARAAIYDLLATLFYAVPDRQLVDALRSEPLQAELSRLLADEPEAAGVGARLRGTEPEQIHEGLAVEYTMLFSAPGASQVVPCESVYCDKLVVDFPPQPEINYPGSRRVFDGLYWGDSAVAVAAEYFAEGFEAGDAMPDSLALELGFMAHLCRREWDFRVEGNVSAADAYAYRQQKFVTEHLNRWVPTFVAKLKAVMPGGFYTACAGLTAAFLGTEAGQELAENALVAAEGR